MLWLCSFPLYSQDSFDPWFQYSNERFLGWHFGPDWYYLKAQGIAESNLDPSAVSHAGAVGVMQFMRPAWGECVAALGINAARTHARASILCGGWYMNRMLRGWTTERSMIERSRFGWASYNAGLGTILRAQRRTNGSIYWCNVRRYAPQETRHYVDRIELIRSGL